MKQFLYATLFSLICLGCSDKVQNNEGVAAGDNKFSIRRGTNIAHWLSQSDRRGNDRATFFTERDAQFIKNAGFDHIRLPVDEEQLWDSAGNREENAFALLNNLITWADAAGLKVVLDLHILRSHHFNADEKPLWTKPEEQDKFIALWKDLSSFVGHWPTSLLAYEFMNEPVADSAEQWNVLLAKVADSIRSWEKERVLVIGSNRWQSADTFDQLRVPANDKNIILSFHFYEPFHLTHYKASWTDMRDFEGEVQYPGQIVVNGTTEEEKKVYNREVLEKMMEKPIRLSKELGLPLYCGEFGIIDGTPEASRLAWYRDMVDIFNEHNIAYANWNYKAGSFGIVDAEMKPKGTLLNILTGK